MNAIKLCEAELEALQELVLDGYPFAQVMYVLQFRPRMSFDSFTVGDKKNNTVKESWLGDCIERRAKQGSQFSSKRRSRDFVQRQIKQLCKYGLLTRLKKAQKRGPMCFFFPLAYAGLFRTLEERTMSAQSTSHNVSLCDHSDESSIVSRSAVVRSSVDKFKAPHNQKEGKSAHIPVNRNIIPNNIYNGDGCSIPKDWKPKKESVDQVRQITLCSDAELDWHIAAFVFYWLERGEARSSWDEVFIWFTSNHGLLR